MLANNMKYTQLTQLPYPAASSTVECCLNKAITRQHSIQCKPLSGAILWLHMRISTQKLEMPHFTTFNKAKKNPGFRLISRHEICFLTLRQILMKNFSKFIIYNILSNRATLQKLRINTKLSDINGVRN